MAAIQKITPFLWFDGRAKEAAKLYTSVFDNSRILSVSSLASGPAEGSHIVSFELEGQEFTALDGGPMFEFSPAISFVVNCDSQEEIDAYWDRLAKDGSPIQCGWIQDKFGVHWQIVPAELSDMMQDEAKSTAVINELITMVKIDLERLRQAYANA